MRIVKPASLGFLQKPYRYRRRSHLAVSAIGFFKLGEHDEGARFLPEQLQWPQAMAALPPGEVLDFAMPKVRGEMLLAASAYAPHGKPVTRLTVRAAVGAIDKSLTVIGEREWFYGLAPVYDITDPTPFMEMPITYARAFGGPACPSNPLGVGYLGRRLPAWFGANRGSAWNIEHPDDPVRSPRQRHSPAGFGPLDIRTPARQAKAGTYGRRWLQQDFPGLAEDIDWSLFNAAPADQQMDGFFVGAEAYRLEGLHPLKPVIEGRLPRLQARAFVHRRDSTADDLEEVSMVCDTVWFFPSRELGAMIYRGRTTISDSDALDVASVMLAYEAADARPRSLEHYRQTLRMRIDRATAALQALNDAPLTPLVPEIERIARAQRRRQAEADDLARRQALLDESIADAGRNNSMQPPQQDAAPTVEALLLPAITPEAVASGEVDLVEAMAAAETRADELRAQAEAQLEALQQCQAPASPSLNVAAQLEDALRRANIIAHDLFDASEAHLPPAFQHLDPAAIDEAQRAQIMSAVRQIPALQRQVRRLSPAPLFPVQPLAAEVAKQLGEVVREQQVRGVCCAGRDLAGADLRGANFAGADLREVMLERADLSGADFRGAQLQGAVLTAACLDDADFTGAALNDANLSLTRSHRTCFRDATLNAATLTEGGFDHADFRGAILSEVIAVKTRLAFAVLAGCDLSRASLTHALADDADFSNARFHMTVLLGAQLRRADFTGATLERSTLLNIIADGSRWRGARLTRVHAGGDASYVGADFRAVVASQCGFRGADLREVNFSGGQFVMCDFGLCRCGGADFRDALLWRSIFMQASLRQCELAGADFFQAMCRKIDLRGSRLRAAHFIQADLSEAVYEDLLAEEAA